MKLVALVCFLLSTSLFAADYQRNSSSFTIPTFTGNGGRVYYNCDSVEHRVKSVLEDMGAVVHSVRCTGGLDRWGGRMHLPASVRVVYDTLNSELDGNVATVVGETQISQRDNCHLNTNIFNAVKGNFEIYKESQRNCFRPSDRTRINIRVLMAQ